MQRTDELLRRREPSIERIRAAQRIGIHHGDRVERRTLLVVRGDAVEIRLDERVTGDAVRADRGVDAGDRRFVDAKGLRAGRERDRGDGEGDEREAGAEHERIECGE